MKDIYLSEWKKEIRKEGINTLSIVVRDYIFNLKLSRGRYFVKVLNFYINDSISSIEDFNHQEDFFTNHCDNWYLMFSFYGDAMDRDSIVYKFSPKMQTEIYTNGGELIEIVPGVHPSKHWIKRLKKSLPECE